MIYNLILSPQAEKDLISYSKSGDKQKLQKVEALFEELKQHPKTGTGKPKMLKHEYSGCWSRRIDSEHRIVYSIEEEIITVFVISAKGHY